MEILQQTESLNGKMKENGILGESPLVQESQLSVPQERSYLQISDGSILPNYCPNPKLTDAKKQDILKPLSTQQLQLVLGTLLGDASMGFQTHYPRYRTNHGMKQKEYVLHKARIMQNYINSPPVITPNLGYGKWSCSFDTVTTPIFEFIRTLCYKKIEGKYMKTITQEWLNYLTWEGIAYWYMDDGSLGKSNALHIHTEGFSMDKTAILSQWLALKGIQTKITMAKKKYYILMMNQENLYKFVEQIRPYIIPSMQYKIAIKQNHCKNCGTLLSSWKSRAIASNIRMPSDQNRYSQKELGSQKQGYQSLQTEPKGNLQETKSKTQGNETEQSNLSRESPSTRTGEICRKKCQKKSTESFKSGNIASIKYAGEQDVYDIETEKYHNFFANGILIHNCQNMLVDILPIVSETMTMSPIKRETYAGTPLTTDNTINELWKTAHQFEWAVKCEHCNHWNTLTEDNEPIKMIQKQGFSCSKCLKLINTLTGQWVDVNPGEREIFGYHGILAQPINTTLQSQP